MLRVLCDLFWLPFSKSFEPVWYIPTYEGKAATQQNSDKAKGIDVEKLENRRWANKINRFEIGDNNQCLRPETEHWMLFCLENEAKSRTNSIQTSENWIRRCKRARISEPFPLSECIQSVPSSLSNIDLWILFNSLLVTHEFQIYTFSFRGFASPNHSFISANFHLQCPALIYNQQFYPTQSSASWLVIAFVAP